MKKNNEEANSLIVQGLSVTTYNKLVEENKKLKSKFTKGYLNYNKQDGLGQFSLYVLKSDEVLNILTEDVKIAYDRYEALRKEVIELRKTRFWF